MSTHKFYGGKMTHLLEARYPDNSKYHDADDAASYETTFESDETRSALLKGKCYLKIDGSCGLLVKKQDGTYTLYRRRDTRGKPKTDNMIELPVGKNSATFHDHTYYMIEMDPTSSNKGEAALAKTYYDILERNKDKLTDDYYSIELIGPQINKTAPEGATPGIVIHKWQVADVTFQERTDAELYEQIRTYFSQNCVEGLIIEYNDVYYKLHAIKFADSLWTKFKTSKILTNPALAKKVLL